MLYINLPSLLQMLPKIKIIVTVGNDIRFRDNSARSDYSRGGTARSDYTRDTRGETADSRYDSRRSSRNTRSRSTSRRR